MINDKMIDAVDSGENKSAVSVSVLAKSLGDAVAAVGEVDLSKSNSDIEALGINPDKDCFVDVGTISMTIQGGSEEILPPFRI